MNMMSNILMKKNNPDECIHTLTARSSIHHPARDRPPSVFTANNISSAAQKSTGHNRIPRHRTSSVCAAQVYSYENLIVCPISTGAVWTGGGCDAGLAQESHLVEIHWYGHLWRPSFKHDYVKHKTGGYFQYLHISTWLKQHWLF